jgi:hypothetical protein
MPVSQADAVVLAPGGAAAIVGIPKTSLASIISSGGFDPTDYSVFRALFGMIFTVIIALQAVAAGGSRIASMESSRVAP